MERASFEGSGGGKGIGVGVQSDWLAYFQRKFRQTDRQMVFISI